MYPQWWTERFGSTTPLGHRLPDRWFRIHSLPGSKRYPEGADDRELLLRRQDAVAREVLGPRCRLVVPVFEASSVGTRAPLADRAGRVFECFASYRYPGHDAAGAADIGVSCDVSFWVADSRWDVATERELLLAIAEDERRALWMNESSGEVFAPYDGGVDVIVSDSVRRNALKSTFAAWLSERPDGL